jgi:hypothetical protein
MRFTFSSADPSWSVSFGSTGNCVGLPAALTGDNLNSLGVQCVTPALARGESAFAAFTVIDTTCLSTDGVAVAVEARRPGGDPATVRSAFGC